MRDIGSNTQSLVGYACDSDCSCALMHSVWAFSGALRLCRFSARSLYLRGKQTCPCLLDSSTSWRFLHYLCKKVGGFNTAIPHHCMPATCQDTDSLMGATDSPAELLKHEVQGIPYSYTWYYGDCRVDQLANPSSTPRCLELMPTHAQNIMTFIE